MLEQIWTWILSVTSQLVIPDWGQLIAFALPVGTTILVAIGLIRTLRLVMTTPPARRGKRLLADRVEPQARRQHHALL